MVDTITVPANKSDLLAYINDRWNAFVAASDAVPDARWTTPVDAAGWSVRDHVAHIVIWVRAEIALLNHGTSLQESTGMPDAIWNSGDFDAMNEWNRQSIQHTSPEAIRAERDRVFPKLIEVVSGYSDEDLAKPARESGLEESDRTLLEVMTEFYGHHFGEHRAYIEQLARAANPA